jgi:phenylalanyl-tRNA synthetase beta chain
VPPPSLPAADRDIALVVPFRVSAADLLATVREAAGATLESAAVVDEYRGEGIPDGARSLAIRLVFRSSERTLRDAEVDSAVRKIVSALEHTHDVVLRST